MTNYIVIYGDLLDGVKGAVGLFTTKTMAGVYAGRLDRPAVAIPLEVADWEAVEPKLEPEPVEQPSDVDEFERKHRGDPCKFCGVSHDDVEIGGCPGYLIQEDETK